MLEMVTCKRIGSNSKLAVTSGNGCEVVMFYRYFAEEVVGKDAKQAADLLRRAQIGEEVHFPCSPEYEKRFAYAVNRCREIGIRIVVDDEIQQMLDAVSEQCVDERVANYPSSWDGFPENACL